MSLRTKSTILVLTSLCFAACSSNGPCGEGRPAGDFCAYSTSAAIVIEGGFECPPELPVEYAFDGVVLCGPASSTPGDAESACRDGGFDCGPPSCDIAPEREDCRPSTGADAGPPDAGAFPCDAGPVDFCREHLEAIGPGCCGASVAPLCRPGGGYACPEGTLESTACGSCP